MCYGGGTGSWGSVKQGPAIQKVLLHVCDKHVSVRKVHVFTTQNVSFHLFEASFLSVQFGAFL